MNRPVYLTAEGIADQTGFPIAVIEQAIEAGDLEAHHACGLRLVMRSEAMTWASIKRAELGRCESCE